MKNSPRLTLAFLNEDILDMIAGLVLEDALTAWPSNDHFLCAVRLSHVCRRLRTILIGRPIFWNRLYISLEVPGVVFDVILARSNQAQLYIFALDPVCLRLIRPTSSTWYNQLQWRKSATAFLDHRSRICELEIHGQNGETGELGLADALAPYNLAQQNGARSYSLRRMALHDINSRSLLRLAGPNIIELSLTGHMLVDGRVFVRALASMTNLRRLALDTIYLAPLPDWSDQLVACNHGAGLEFIMLGWAGHTRAPSDLTDFRDLVLKCLPRALNSAQEVRFEFRHNHAWTNVAFDLLALVELSSDCDSSVLEIDGEANRYTHRSFKGRVCILSTPSLREATATRFHSEVVSSATTLRLICDGGNLSLLDSRVLAPWERSGIVSNTQNLDIVFEIPDLVDYTMLSAVFSRTILMPELRSVYFRLSSEGEAAFIETAERLALAPICVELLKCFHFPARARQFFAGPPEITEAIWAASDGEYHFSSRYDDHPLADKLA